VLELSAGQLRPIKQTEKVIEMKKVEMKSFFKKVSEGQVKSFPILADRLGKKREDISWHFEGFASAEDIGSVSSEHVCFFLNKALETFGRDLIADNGTDWDFVPSADKLTLSAAFDYYNEETKRERILTKVSTANFAIVYAKHAATALGITPAAANAAAGVISDWLKYGKDEKVSAAMLARLSSFAEVLTEAAEDSELATDTMPHVEVLMALIKFFEPKESTPAISADAL